jgi:hypothetical protein
MISVDVRTVLGKERTMTEPTEQTTAELIAELNADLRARDPMKAMKQQIRLKALDEVRVLVSEQRLADDAHAETYRRVESIIADLAQPALA